MIERTPVHPIMQTLIDEGRIAVAYNVRGQPVYTLTVLGKMALDLYEAVQHEKDKSDEQ